MKIEIYTPEILIILIYYSIEQNSSLTYNSFLKTSLFFRSFIPFPHQQTKIKESFYFMTFKITVLNSFNFSYCYDNKKNLKQVIQHNDIPIYHFCSTSIIVKSNAHKMIVERLVVSTVLTLAGLTLFFYALYGDQFIHEAYTYHITR